MQVTERQREILECMFNAWIEADMPLPGCYSYGEVCEFVESLGIDSKGVEEHVSHVLAMMEN